MFFSTEIFEIFSKFRKRTLKIVYIILCEIFHGKTTPQIIDILRRQNLIKSFSSIYYHLSRLEKLGLIARLGARSACVTYKLTEKGKEFLRFLFIKFSMGTIEGAKLHSVHNIKIKIPIKREFPNFAQNFWEKEQKWKNSRIFYKYIKEPFPITLKKTSKNVFVFVKSLSIDDSKNFEREVEIKLRFILYQIYSLLYEKAGLEVDLSRAEKIDKPHYVLDDNFVKYFYQHRRELEKIFKKDESKKLWIDRSPFPCLETSESEIVRSYLSMFDNIEKILRKIEKVENLKVEIKNIKSEIEDVKNKSNIIQTSYNLVTQIDKKIETLMSFCRKSEEISKNYKSLPDNPTLYLVTFIAS